MIVLNSNCLREKYVIFLILCDVHAYITLIIDFATVFTISSSVMLLLLNIFCLKN